MNIKKELQNLKKKLSIIESQSFIRRDIKTNAEKILDAQKDTFAMGATLSYKYRMWALEKLEEAIKKYEEEIYDVPAMSTRRPFSIYQFAINHILNVKISW